MEHPAEIVEQVLQQAEQGQSVPEVCHRFGITDTSFYNWRRKYAGLNAAGIERNRQLERENRALRQRLDRLSLDKAVLQHVIGSGLNVRRRKALMPQLLCRHPISRRRAGQLLQLSDSATNRVPDSS